MKCFACKRENLGRGVGRAAVLCLLLMLLCVSASAANVCAVNGTEYATLSEGLGAAQSALSNGAVRVTLLADARLDGKSSVILTVATEPKTARVKGKMTITKFRAYDDSAQCEIVFFNQEYVRSVIRLQAI